MLDKDKDLMEEKKNKLIELTTGFTDKHLNKEYEQVILKMINKMARKRAVPFLAGKV